MRLLLLLLSCLFVFSSFAFSKNDFYGQHDNYVSLFYMAGDLKNPADSGKLNFDSGQVAGNLIESRLSTSGLIGFEFGHVITYRSSWFNPIHIGVEVWQMLNTNESGQFIYKRNLPYNLYNYQSDINTNGVGLDTSIDLLRYEKVSPFLSINAGVDYIRSGGSNLVPLNNSDITSLQFQGSDNFNLYYGATIGIRYRMYKRLSARIGYNYSDFGNYNIGPGVVFNHTIPPVNKRLVFNGVRASISLLF